jgi:hypothetical protein
MRLSLTGMTSPDEESFERLLPSSLFPGRGPRAAPARPAPRPRRRLSAERMILSNRPSVLHAAFSLPPSSSPAPCSGQDSAELRYNSVVIPLYYRSATVVLPLFCWVSPPSLDGASAWLGLWCRSVRERLLPNHPVRLVIAQLHSIWIGFAGPGGLGSLPNSA